MSLGRVLTDLWDGTIQLVRSLVHAVAAGFYELSTRIESSDYRLLYEHLYLAPGLSLLAEEQSSEERVLERLEEALRDAPFVERICVALADSDLGDVHRERAIQGLRGVLEPGAHWTLACDQLHRALEGALWDAALAEGVIDEQRSLTGTQRPGGAPGRRAMQPVHLLDPDLGLQMDPYLRRLLRNRIFDSASHDLRHGRASAHTRRYALESALALLDWLDRGSQQSSAVAALADRINDLEGTRVPLPEDSEGRSDADQAEEVTSALTLGGPLPDWRSAEDSLKPPVRE